MDSEPLRDPPLSKGDARIVRGKILGYRVFDAGDTISLETAEKGVAKAARLDIGGPLTEGLLISARPITIEIGATEVRVSGFEKPFRVHAAAHVFEFGAISIVYEFPIESGATFSSITPLCDALYDSLDLDAHAMGLLAGVVGKLGECIEKPHPAIEPESYTIVFAESISGIEPSELHESETIAKLLLGETTRKPLSPAVARDVTKHAFSYLTDDVVIVDWNSAIVIEPSGSMVVPHVLELATSQLLEFRYYDTLLDRELGRVYDQVGKTRQRIFRSPYGALTRQVLRRFMELTEFTERVDNAIKSVGDFYLARVYLSAISRFRVPEWRESVEGKLKLVEQAYGLLKGDVEATRNTLLEVIVIVLIVAELVTALRGGH